MPIPQLKNKVQPPRHWRELSNQAVRKVKNQAPQDWRGWLKKLLPVGGGLLLLLLLYIIFLSFSLPSPDKLMERQIVESTKIYDRDCNTLLYEVHGDQKRTLVDFKDIPEHVKNATVAIEDKNFYKHKGFSVLAIARTAVTNVIFGRKAGGSTLTQQFIKNAVFTNEKKYTRKIKELILAYRLEQKFSKEKILQMYLNEIPYGSNTYGVESASQFYFGKRVNDINLAEAAILAALPQGPSRYSPYGPNKDLLIKRQQYILDLMVEQGYINTEEAKVAKETPLKFQQRIENIKAPHFVMYIKELVAEKYGQKTVEQGGLKICTTLDVNKQDIAEKAVAEQGEKNAGRYKASNAALVAVDPKTGEVLAMVGSRDYFNEDIDGQVNVALKPRQPGSSFKPIVYTAAFMKGFLPETMVYDVNTNFSTDPANSYEPKNYNGMEYGPVSLRQALAGSLNTPAVKTMYLAGIDNVLELAKKLGYTSLTDKDRYGLTLVLGGGEVKLLEHVNAYSALAREGELPQTVFIRKIEDSKGSVLEEFKEPKIEKVLDANIARMTNSIMSDNGARAFIFGGQNYLTLGDRPVAAKTGTTNDYRDAWTIGYTPSLVAGVWVGNNDYSKMAPGSDGSVVAAPIWNAFMRGALAGSPVESFNGYSIPDNTRPILLGKGFAERKVKIDKASGLLATDATPPEMIEEKTYAQTHDILYFVDKNNPNGDQPGNPAQDPQFNNWEQAVGRWIEAKRAKDPNFLTNEPPTESDNLHVSGNLPSFTVNGISQGQTVSTETLNISVFGNAPRGIKLVEYYIDGNLFTANTNPPYNFNRALSALPNGSHKLSVKVCDDIYNCASADYDFELNIMANDNVPRSFNISWAGPANGAVFKEKDLPLNLKVNLLSPENIATINFYLAAGDQTQLIGNKKIVRSDVETFAWNFDKQNPAGTYTVWAEALGWNGQKISTDKTTLKFEPDKSN